MKKIFALSAIYLCLLAGCTPPAGYFAVQTQQQTQTKIPAQITVSPQQATQNQPTIPSQPITQSSVLPQPSATSQPSDSSIFPPLSDAKSRITKKTFGIYITPKTSPVQPERFTGYHTGTDFETFPDEQNTDVPVYAMCAGPLRLKEWASGYGGVAVQQCTIANELVTVIYGHVRLSSITFAKGDQIAAGTQLGVLGTGYSKETDGERKHLHLGIHKGITISILGYVQNKADLGNWLDAEQYLL